MAVDDGHAQRSAYVEFVRRYPDYGATLLLDELRAAEYGRLDREHHVYLDYTGAGVYAESQVRRHAELLVSGVFGNPHSASPSSLASTSLIEKTRKAVLAWFNAPAGEYTAVFTANATAALKLVGESYPFGSASRLLMTADNHNSVNGIREFALQKGASVEYAPLTTPDLRIKRSALDGLLEGKGTTAERLFAFPAQSNFSGVRHPLDLVDQAHANGWDVLLDAAAFVPANYLDLTQVPADFISISFYKMFGYPTGVGCLLVRNTVLSKLRRPWFAGGTVNFATVQGRRHILAAGEAGFEDGTLNYLSIPAVQMGLDHLQSIGIDTIHTRVHCLTGWVIEQLLDLKHSNGHHMVRIYGPADTISRGGTVTLNFYDPDGHLLDYRRVEELAGQQRISLRTGCFCNPGAGETAEGLTEEDMVAAAAIGAEMTLPRFLQFITHRGGKGAGAIRISFGIASNFADAYKFVDFAAGLRDQTQMTIGNVTFDIEACRVIRDGS
jgi:selenocysteine lyase/cysteine desulfurase